MTHFLQSESWRLFQKALKNKTVHKATTNWEYTGIVEHGRLNSRLYLPYGPSFNDTNALLASIDDIISTAKKLSVDFIRIEPQDPNAESLLATLGFRRTKSIQPAHTIVNDTSLDKEAILAKLSESDRRIWRKNLRMKATFHTSYDPNDITIFIDMIHDVAKRTGMRPHDDHYFTLIAKTLFPLKKAGIMYETLEGHPVASIVFFTDGQTMIYAHAASYTSYRKLSPATALATFALLYAHDTHHTSFDFYGIAPEGADKSHPWIGFTHFKKSFGGTPVSYAGTWELPLNPFRYRLYSLYQSLRRFL